jgi:succinyl-diaminopimelate desuccinylase
MIDQSIIDRISHAVDSIESELIDFACQIIRIPTVNPPGLHYPECAKAIGDMMEQIGMEVEMVDVPDDRLAELAPTGEMMPRVNVIGRLPGAKKRPLLHFSGHYDVVPAGTGWTTDPFGAVIKNGKIYGRGASDQKSGIVSQIFAIYALKKAGITLEGTLLSSATPDEETGGFAGLGYLVEQGVISKHNTDYFVITECLDVDKICLGHRGTLWFEIETKGKQSHGSMPSEGVNAIIHMQHVLNAIENVIQPQLTQESKYPVMPEACRKSTLTVTTMKAGNKINTVPNSCTATFDWRLIPEQSTEWATNELEKMIETLSTTVPNFDSELRLLMKVDPTLVPNDTKVVEAFLDSAESIIGVKPEFSISPGSDDQKFVVQEAGIQQCIVYGPGPLKMAHKSDEYVAIEDLMTAAKVMAVAAVELLGMV